MDVYSMDPSLLEQELYGNDRRMFEVYLRDGDKMRQAALPVYLSLDGFPQEEREELEKLVTVKAQV